MASFINLCYCQLLLFHSSLLSFGTLSMKSIGDFFVVVDRGRGAFLCCIHFVHVNLFFGFSTVVVQAIEDVALILRSRSRGRSIVTQGVWINLWTKCAFLGLRGQIFFPAKLLGFLTILIQTIAKIGTVGSSNPRCWIGWFHVGLACFGGRIKRDSFGQWSVFKHCCSCFNTFCSLFVQTLVGMVVVLTLRFGHICFGVEC